MANDNVESGNPNANSQRPKRQLDSSGVRKERRVIKRVSDAELRKNIKHVGVFCRVIALTAFVFAGSMITHSIMKNTFEQTRSLFIATVIVVEGFGFFVVAGAAKSYIQNESVGRLTKLSERLKLCMAITAFLVVLLAGAQIYTWAAA